MINIIRSDTRGSANHGWLDAKHSFSFADYHDPDRMGFGSLRVINEDRIKPGKGFGTHPHRDMEIITYIVNGAIEHKDSMGNGTVIRAGEVQRMTAGTGVTHSEFNHSNEEELHLLQIWVLPEQPSLTPGYEQKLFTTADKADQLKLIASRDGRGESIKVHQEVDLYASVLSPGSELTHAFAAGRSGWLQVVSGQIEVDGEMLSAGDGAAISDVETIDIKAVEQSEFLLFDLA